MDKRYTDGITKLGGLTQKRVSSSFYLSHTLKTKNTRENKSRKNICHYATVILDTKTGANTHQELHC